MHNNDYTDQFQSTPSVWRETKTAGIHGHSAVISIHSLRVEGDAKLWFNCNPDSPISIHSLRVEGDRLDDRRQIFGYISIHSLRVEGDYLSWAWAWAEINFNPLPPCGGRLIDFTTFKVLYGISIHSLRVEGDNYAHRFQHFVAYFNPLPPCGGRHAIIEKGGSKNYFNPLPPCGGRPQLLRRFAAQRPFQSTPSVWRETVDALRQTIQRNDFNPLPPCGGRQLRKHPINAKRGISIHSLRVEGDPERSRLPDQVQFQSTPSVWRETGLQEYADLSTEFQSTPSVWRETSSSAFFAAITTDFNPLPPCGGRR